MGLVEHPAEAEPLAERSQPPEVGAVAIHRINALGHDEDDAVEGRLLVEHQFQRVEVVMGEAPQACPGFEDPVQHARMDQPVGQHEVALPRQAAQHRGVGGVAGVEHQRVFVTLPIGQGPLEALMQFGVTGDEGRGRGGGAPCVEGGGGGGDHGGVAGKPEVIVVGEVDATVVRGARDEPAAQGGALALQQ
jgi:hypothetical protein